MSDPTDVLIVGGGPGGSTAAILLAQRGFKVTLLEKDQHPRFHIGESLLPANLPLLEQLGVGEAVRAIGMVKNGAEFVSYWDQRRQEFLFADAWDKSMPSAYQVRRSEFDQILIDRARAAGAEVHERTRVRTVTLPQGNEPVRAQATAADGSTQEWQARFIIDASGRDTLLSNQLGLKRRNPRHASAAVFGHFQGVGRYDGDRAGHITIYWFDHGWFWVIPLRDGVTSVGAVVWPYYLKTRQVPVPQFFDALVQQCPPLAERMRGATAVGDIEATGNYSYLSTRSSGDHYLLLGDAFAFIDPVFSSGVMLAMQGAFAAADAVDTCLRHPERARAALRRYDKSSRHGPKEFSWFIYRITSPTMRELFLGPRNLLRMKEALLSVLAGDIYGSTPIWNSVRAFKTVYRVASVLSPRRSLRALRQRRINIQST